MKISYVLGLFLNIQDSSAVGLKQKFVTDNLKELAVHTAELGILQTKMDRYQRLSPRIDAAISGVHEILTPIPYVQHNIVHHSSPDVMVHDVYDAAPVDDCGYYHTCGGGVVSAAPFQYAPAQFTGAPIQYAAPVHVNHVHHNHHIKHTKHVHHVHHVHHKKEDLELKLMAGAALDKINQKDEAEQIKSMAAAALTKVNMPQPDLREMAAKALAKLDSKDVKKEKCDKACQKLKSTSNAQVSDDIETLQSKAIDLVDKEYNSKQVKKEDKVEQENLKEAEEIAEKEAERLSPSMAQKDVEEEGIETFRI